MSINWNDLNHECFYWKKLKNVNQLRYKVVNKSLFILATYMNSLCLYALDMIEWEVQNYLFVSMFMLYAWRINYPLILFCEFCVCLEFESWISLLKLLISEKYYSFHYDTRLS